MKHYVQAQAQKQQIEHQIQQTRAMRNRMKDALDKLNEQLDMMPPVGKKTPRATKTKIQEMKTKRDKAKVSRPG